jgi:hypothetical protein
MAALSELSVNHNRRKASDTQFLGACEYATVRHIAYDDFAGLIRSPTYHLDCVITQGTARTEDFDFAPHTQPEIIAF